MPARLAIPALSLLGLVAVYGAIIVGEAIATMGPMAAWRASGLPPTLLRIVILALTAAPVAYLMASGLMRRAPAIGLRVITAVALLFTAALGLLQLFVYAPSVLGATILKILFVIVPFGLVAFRYRSNRQA